MVEKVCIKWRKNKSEIGKNGQKRESRNGQNRESRNGTKKEKIEMGQKKRKLKWDKKRTERTEEMWMEVQLAEMSFLWINK